MLRQSLLSTLMAGTVMVAGLNPAHARLEHEAAANATRTPIKHLIVIIGENHTFDNVFATYQAPHGQQVDNLLSKGIVDLNGDPAARFALGRQRQADVATAYTPTPHLTGAYSTLPQPATTYATGVPAGVPDARFPANLPNGPFQITKYVTYAAHTGDPIHRFFQMYQQVDAGKMDLFPWVGVTAGIGPQNSPPAPTPGHTFQGGEAMGFYNMATGDAPVFQSLAQHYAISDNYHQAIMGGTGANFIAIVTGDVGFHTDQGQADVPLANQIENPNPQPGTNNFFTQDGYGGGSYVNCADRVQPGVAAVYEYLDSLHHKVFNGGNCAAGAYYLVNNYGLAYDYMGNVKPLGPTHTTLPPQTIPTIADALSAKSVSWKWYSGGRHANSAPDNEYCTICDPLTGFSSIMTTSLKDNLQGMDEFYADVQSPATLPAVAFIRPFESKAGHPANASMPDFEAFVEDVVKRVQANPKVWAETAILVTTDEGGGYYDSGYVQPVDFFGDGTRIPLIAISPYAKPGFVDHTYGDHASILKFIEHNWGLKPLSARSRDNLPNPVMSEKAYVPANAPAVGDLMALFDFNLPHAEGHGMKH
jgi:acid phosphatase